VRRSHRSGSRIALSATADFAAAYIRRLPSCIFTPCPTETNGKYRIGNPYFQAEFQAASDGTAFDKARGIKNPPPYHNRASSVVLSHLFPTGLTADQNTKAT
jgi:hypothetical protein